MEHENQRALFADGTMDYRNPMEPNIGDRLTLRFRTARRSAKKGMLCICGKYWTGYVVQCECFFWRIGRCCQVLE